MTLDTPATIKALARTNDIAKARKLALSAIERETRSTHTAETLGNTIREILARLEVTEKNACL
jgi:hypothetical protein